MKHWPRVLDLAALLLAFNLCAAPVAVGQGDDVEPTLAKERVKGAGMTTYTSDEWEQELAHQDWVEQTKMVSEYMVKSITENPEHIAYATGRGPLIVQRPYHYADAKSAATYN